MSDPFTLIASPPGGGRHYGVFGHTYRVLATGEQTEGRYALMEIVVPPSDGPPPHHHTREDEAFFVIEGTLVFVVEGREISSGPDSFIAVPKGAVHTFRNPGPETARALILVSPAGFEAFIREVGVPIADPSGDPPPSTVDHMQRVVAAAPRFGMEIHLAAAG